MVSVIAQSETIKEFLRPEIIWTLVGMALLLMEFMLPGLIVFFFGVGALVVAAVCVFVEISIEWQLGLFVIASTLMLITLRHILKKVFMGTQTAKDNMSENISEYIGQQATVKTTIKPSARGTVEFHGTDWTAESEHEIQPGTTVRIVGQDNLVLKVKPI